MKLMHSRQRGASLIEALVAMVVLAMGVMGLAATQIRTLITARTVEFRAVAMQATDDLRDRIQANSEIRLKPLAGSPYVTSWGETPPIQVDCQALPCDGVQLAAFDMAQWKSALVQALPDGDALVFFSDKDPFQLGILLAWTEARQRNESMADEVNADRFAQAVAVRDALGAAGTGVADKQCPEHHICHLVYFRP